MKKSNFTKEKKIIFFGKIQLSKKSGIFFNFGKTYHPYTTYIPMTDVYFIINYYGYNVVIKRLKSG